MNKRFIISLLVIIVLGVVMLVLAQDDQDSTTLDNATTTNTTTTAPQDTQATVPADWQQYENPAFDFTFQYPSAATTSVEAGRAKVQLIGPASEPNTEITDGFTFYVRTESFGDATSTESFAQSYYQEESRRLETIEAPHQISVAGETGYTFTLEGEIGSNTIYRVLPAEGDQVFVTTAIVADPNNQGYADMIETMLGTLRVS